MGCSDGYPTYTDPYLDRKDRMIKALKETPMSALTADYIPDVQAIYNYKWPYELEYALKRLEEKLGLPPL